MTVAAFALGWLDPLTLGVELEPVGVHPAHQRRGLGRAVCRATLRAARGLGAGDVLIAAEAANAAATGLYAALGLRGRGASRRLSTADDDESRSQATDRGGSGLTSDDDPTALAAGAALAAPDGPGGP